MKTRALALSMSALLGTTACSSAPTRPDTQDVIVSAVTFPQAPDTLREDITETLHGKSVSDPYRWLEDISNPSVQAWVKVQNAFTRTQLDAIPNRSTLSKRFTELLFVDSMSAPRRMGDFYFYSRNFKDKDKAVLYVREGENGAERVLLDPNTWAEGATTALGESFATQDGRILAYKIKPNNADEAELKFIDVKTGEALKDHLVGVKYAGLSWNKEGTGFWYVYLPPVGGEITIDNRPSYAEVRFHKLGEDQSKDAFIFPATGSSQTFLDINVSRDGRWLFLSVMHGWNRTEVYVRDLKQKVAGEPKPAPSELDVDARVAFNAAQRGFKPLFVGHDATADVREYKGSFYIHTNLDAPRYRILKVNPAKLDQKHWQELVPQREATIEGMTIAGNKLVLQLLNRASNQLEVRELSGKLAHEVQLPTIGTIQRVSGHVEDDTAYYTFTSFANIPETFKFSISKGTSELWSKIDVPIDTSSFEVKQVFYPSKDGTPISMFIVHKKGITLDGSHPTLLYGYGGFNVSLTPSYSSSVAVWLELGGVYAVPNLRGGGEYGEEWHRDGMLDKKQNVFDDFIAASEYLIKEGYTTTDKLGIRGGSNGGLLVGAAMTQRPDLYKAVICAVPLLDMVRYHLFGSGRTWIPEYGSPDKAEEFNTLFAYSPYHHVKVGTRYPSLLMLGADTDDRVDPMHARKFLALIQWANSQAKHEVPSLFRLEANAGHGGGAKLSDTVEYLADQYAYLAWQLGIQIPESL